ncbi:MAG: hypothetical protein FJW39_31560 [Acidobacteria bacterium]|nr:hypothetical protein [Acidobacteriota bacterium]
MPNSPAQARYSITKLQLFPVYATVEDFQKATGNPAPAFDASRAPKLWFDPKAAESPRRNVVYDNVVALGPQGQPLTGPDGKPALEPMLLSREHAATVNIPPRLANVPGANVPEVPVPLRPLNANEEIYLDFGGVMVRDTSVPDESDRSGFTGTDRALLKAIAAKLGL